MEVEVEIDRRTSLAVVVRDEGEGISARGDSRGLGLALISALSETVRVTRDELGHTAVHMTFALPRAAEPLA